MASLAAFTLLWPGSPIQGIWRLNPGGHDGLARFGAWGVVLMVAVAMACAIAGVGLIKGAAWGRAAAITVLGLNLLGDAGNAFYRGDLRTLIGVPVGAALIAYLLSRRVRAYFQSTNR